MTPPTPHIEAAHGEIADAVLLPGDPLRAEAIAEAFLDDVRCYNRVRNMLGFTGTYRGRPVSVQGTGMGLPSMSIYLTELVRHYGVRTAIRVGSCGAIRADVALRDVVIASAAHTSSAMNRRRFKDVDFAAAASFPLVSEAARLAGERQVPHHVGTIFSSDFFYDDDPEVFELLARHGALAVEMEASALYTIAAGEGAAALCLATVSDHIPSGERLTAEERRTGFEVMAGLALDVVSSTA